MTNPRGNTTIDGQTAELILERPFRDPQGTILYDLTNYGSASIFSAAALRSNVGTPANQWVPYQGDNNVQVTMRSVDVSQNDPLSTVMPVDPSSAFCGDILPYFTG